MRAPGGAGQRYAAGIVPQNPDDMAAFLRQELGSLQSALQALADGQLDLITVTPAKPRDGMLRFAAAGVLGASAGFYGFYAAGWKFLG